MNTWTLCLCLCLSASFSLFVCRGVGKGEIIIYILPGCWLPKITPSVALALARTWPSEQPFFGTTPHVILFLHKQAHIRLQPSLGHSSHYSSFPTHWVSSIPLTLSQIPPSFLGQLKTLSPEKPQLSESEGVYFPSFASHSTIHIRLNYCIHITVIAIVLDLCLTPNRL